MKKNDLFGFGAIFLLLVACSQQTSVDNGESEPELNRLAFTSTLDGSTREFFVYLPHGYQDDMKKDWPVMLFLHGNGERGNGIDELGYVLANGPLYEAWIQKRNLPFIIVSPQLPTFGMDETAGFIGDRDSSQILQRLVEGVAPRPERFPTPNAMDGVPAPESMADMPLVLPNGWDRIEADLLMMLDSVEENFRTDSQRVYLTGLSYGGFGTWYMASRHPERFAAISPVVGWGHPDLMEPIANQQIPLWVFAAGRDPVVKIEHFYPGVNRLESLGHTQVRFTNHEDMGHDAWTRVYRSDDFYNWLLEQRNTR